MKQAQLDLDNYMAIEVLERLGIVDPDQEKIDLIETLLTNVTVKKKIMFDSRLTPREQCCLYWSAKGKTSEQIARICNIQKVTVDGYKKEVLRKLGCSTITQSVFEGIRFGYFDGVSAN